MKQIATDGKNIPSNLNSWLRDLVADANKEPGRFTLRAWLINSREAAL